MKKRECEKIKSFQLITDETFMRFLKSESAKDGKTMTAFIIEAVQKLIEEKNK
ncbi:hypothetical protein KKE34_05710 [Patescibacteria group bacterium]|nr:hypothetical protein [Patescibacteria group bacterium]